jgi:hypothetical protein
MASFRTHISFGIALSIASVFALASFALVPSEWSLFMLVALAVIVGAILPDMDSDSGVPFHVTFGSLALVAGGVALIYALKIAPGDYRIILGAPLLALFVVWIVIGWLFKKFTVHRGMAHSIPAALLSGLIVFSFAVRMGLDAWQAFLVGVALTLGYLLHLILDEVNSVVNFHGTPFVPNKALGSALKMKSNDAFINVAVYGAIVFILLNNGKTLSQFTQKLFETIS